MLCHNCGKRIADDARFCGFCGSSVGKKACPSCGQEVEAGMAYCSFCGSRVDAAGAASTNRLPVARPAAGYQNQATVAGTNAYNSSTVAYGQTTGPLKSVEVTWFDKEVKAMGFSEATGTLSIYPNRLELKKKMGSSKSYLAGGVIGLAVSAAMVKKDPPVIFQMNQIANIREAKYGASVRIILEMKNGETNMFVANKKLEREFHECADLIRIHMR